jgi:hypothetical protein
LASRWRAATEALLLVAERGGGTMLPSIGIMKALYPGDGAPFPADVVGRASEQIY